MKKSIKRTTRKVILIAAFFLLPGVLCLILPPKAEAIPELPYQAESQGRDKL